MRKIMATTTSVTVKGQMRPGFVDKSPSLSPSPPLRHARKFGTSNSGGRVGAATSEVGICAGIRDLNLGGVKGTKSGPKQFDNRRTFCSNGSRLILRNLTDIANMLKDGNAKNVVIVAGAGISTPSGIPDFRTPGTGLYDNLQQYKVPYPEAIFDIDFFMHNPRPFFTLAKELYPSGKYRPNYLHYFARLLSDRGLLLRMYTQNIDGLERLAGVPPEKLVEAHGTFVTASCIACREKHRGSEIKDAIFDDKLPRCKRSGCPGVVKPDIVFFGEELPKRFYFYLKDMLQTDLVLIMGTSLEVQPFAGIIDTVRWSVPRVLFNRNAVGPFRNNKRAKDFLSEGDLIDCVQDFAHMAGMKEDMYDLITRCEGTFRLFATPPPPEPVKKISGKASKMTSDPLLAAVWKHNARSNVFSDSDSTDSSDGSESESESTTSSSGQRKGNQPAHGSKPSSVRSSPGGKRGVTLPVGGLRGNRSNNNSNGGGGSGPTTPSRNHSTGPLLWRRKDSKPAKKAVTPTPTPLFLRRKPPTDPSHTKKPPPAPGTHATKPRSSSVSKAAPEKARSTSQTASVGFRVGSAKPAIQPRLTYQHRPTPSPKALYDARILTLLDNSSSTSSSDEDDREDLDDDSSSSDSR